MSGTPVPEDHTMPYHQPVEAVIASLGADAQLGLSDVEARPGLGGMAATS